MCKTIIYNLISQLLLQYPTEVVDYTKLMTKQAILIPTYIACGAVNAVQSMSHPVS